MRCFIIFKIIIFESLFFFEFTTNLVFSFKRLLPCILNYHEDFYLKLFYLIVMHGYLMFFYD